MKFILNYILIGMFWAQPKPDTKKYVDLISDISHWVIKVPKFQRDFVWSIEDTAKLLDSILKGYPIWTFILWETNERLNEIKDIWNLELPPTPAGMKVQYVLDGQQRITSLYAAYKGARIQKQWEKKITDYSEIYVDLSVDPEDEDNQIIVAEKPEWAYLSLNEVLDFQNHLTDFMLKFDSEQIKRINWYSQAFQTYDFSTILLRKDKIESAIEVFTRINTWGKKLTLFEIMSAKTFDEEKNFDMSKLFNHFIDEAKVNWYETISNSTILMLLGLMLSKNKECKSKVILQLDKDAIIENWDEAISCLKWAIDFFRSVYRIPVSSFLPYDSLLIPFAYYYHYKKDDPIGNDAKYLEEFFWRMALSNRYSSSTETKLSQDIKRIDDILNWKRPTYSDDIVIRFNSPQDLINTYFRVGSSFCKAILCLLAYQEPKDFRNNWKVFLDNNFLKAANSKNYHHFFPKAYLWNNDIENENSLVNITLVSWDLNKNKIRAKAPSQYIQEFMDINPYLKETLKSHLIDFDAWILSNDYNVFLQARAKRIYDELMKRLEWTIDNSNNEDEEVKELIYKWENERFELKSSMRYDIRQWIVNPKLEFIIAKTISAFLNSEWWILLIWVDDDWNILWLEKDFETLKPKDNKDWYELHLRNIITKYLNNSFESYLKIDFPVVDWKTICKIKVEKSGKPVFIKNEWIDQFFVRIGNSSIPKSREEQSEYEKIHRIQ